MKTVSITISFLMAMVFLSCFEDPDCTKLENGIIVLSFLKEKEDDVEDELSFAAVRVAGSEKVLYELKQAKRIGIPLNFSVNEQDITIEFSPSASYQLRVRYKVKMQFVHKKCDPRRVFSDLEIVRHDFSFAQVVSTFPQQLGGPLEGSLVNQKGSPLLVNIQLVR